MSRNLSAGTTKCSECGCPCQNCTASTSGFACQQEEIEKLRNLARSQQGSIARLEAQLQSETDGRSRDQHRLQEELSRLRDRYDRLLDAHKKLGRLNSSLEERLLGMAERLSDAETRQADSQQRLDEADAAAAAARLEADRCRADCALAVQLLQSRPPDSLMPSSASPAMFTAPAEAASMPSASVSVSVPLPTFPPTFAHVPTPPTQQQQQQQLQRQKFLSAAAAGGAQNNQAPANASSSPVLHL